MNNIDLEKQIIELIPSKTMRDAIKENNHKFTDIEYVQLVEEYSKSWENKLNLLKQIMENKPENLEIEIFVHSGKQHGLEDVVNDYLLGKLEEKDVLQALQEEYNSDLHNYYLYNYL